MVRLIIEDQHTTMRGDPITQLFASIERFGFRDAGPAHANVSASLPRRSDTSVSYVRHSAFSGRFWREFDDWFLTIEPTYVFTRDGVRSDRFAGERISKLKRLENNAAIRGQFVMWRSLLTGFGLIPSQGDLLAPASIAAPLLRFESLDMLRLPVSVPDDLWRSRDAYAPQDNEEELPL
jgi:hypothetical protein